MATDEPTPSSLAKQLENIDAEIVKTRASSAHHKHLVREYERDLLNQERARDAIVAQLAVKIGLVKPRKDSVGRQLPMVSALTEEELQQADTAVNGAVKEISEEVNRSGQE